jgi:acetolactate synthase-1/2/3 large subunit
MVIGQVERQDFGRLALQEQNYSRLLSDVTKLVIEVNEPEQASEAIARAFHVAESGTPGPVAVIVPEDVFDTETEATVDAARPRVVSAPRPNDLDRLAVMLEAAERPLVLVGGGLLADALHDNAAFGDLKRLAEQWVLPISPTHRRPQLFDATHPNYGGYMGIRVPPDLLGEMKRADLMVALGERMTDSVSQSYTFPTAPQPQLPFVHVWPDPNEVGRVWRPDLGIPCNPYEVVKALLRRSPPADADKRRRWVAGLNAIHRKLLAKEWEPTGDGVNFAAVVCEVDKHLAPDATVTTDAGNFASFVHRYIGFRQGQVFLASVVGAMGSGMPMAVAAALRRPGKQVVAFVGDGGALMTGNEIATARQYGANPIMIISDNRMYGTIGMHSYVRYPERPLMAGTRLTNPDFAQWGRSFGAEGITIRNESEVGDGIARAFAVKTRPVVVHCLTSAIQMSAWRRYTRGATLP